MSDPLVVLGEVRTSLLPHSTPLSEPEVVHLLSIVPGIQVSARKRPLARVVSPSLGVGVDCDLATRRGRQARARAIGTVSARVVVVGGRVGQSSATTRVVRAQRPSRQNWSHYLANLGTVELIPRIGDDATVMLELCEGFLEYSGDTTLDLGSISEQLQLGLRMDPLLDHRPSLHTSATRLRWAARVAAQPSGSTDGWVRLEFRLEDEIVRSARITVSTEANLAGVQQFCEDLAVHDWLLTTVSNELAAIDSVAGDRDTTPRMTALLRELAHLWMPGAHTPGGLRGLWTSLEHEPGFTRQWKSEVGRLRDRLLIANQRRSAAE
ncbi:SCO2521 family protein [Nocardia huaxiensis]|uniref:SCO2521 family protein n=1 Tax=Nocardia huaxiensis TaxID=2755382 RepID=UPI001E3D1629|nr:SCO2521 family protein [Nocardia huaxiensis]UFS94516.1 SCO2521 family protein [Nocardia huaxiensis]